MQPIKIIRGINETDFICNGWGFNCHGPQVLITAGVLEGRTCTGVGGIKEELEEAGAIYEDIELVIDGNLITSRIPPDLAVFSQAIGEAVMASFDE